MRQGDPDARSGRSPGALGAALFAAACQRGPAALENLKEAKWSMAASPPPTVDDGADAMEGSLWLEEKPLQVGFELDGIELFRGGYGIAGSPLEGSLRLFAVRGPHRTEVASLAD